MQLVDGNLVVMIVPHSNVPIYANILTVQDETILLRVKQYWLLKEDCILTCIVVNGTEMFEFYSKVRKIEKDLVQIRGYKYSGLTSVDNRKFNRVSCDIGFLAKLYALNQKPLTDTDLASKRFTGRVKNISASGILVQTELLLPKGIQFFLNLNIGDFVERKAEVKWAEQQNNVRNLGCEFVGQSVDDVRQLSMFVFNEYIKQESKNLSKTGGLIV